MAVIRFFICVIMALAAGGCGQTVKETLHVPENIPLQISCPKSIVVLPFADYFFADDIRSGLIRNSIVMEYLVDRLVAKGVQVPVQEDVIQYLADKEIISLLAPDAEKENKNRLKSLADELREDYNDDMKDELRRILEFERGRKRVAGKNLETLWEAPGMYALDKKSVQAIGKFFQADYLIRGRIIEYYLKRGKSNGITYNPSQAVVHLRVWVQNTATGQVVWTNRAEVQVSPQSDLAADDTATLFETALNKAATNLMDDFWKKVSS